MGSQDKKKTVVVISHSSNLAGAERSLLDLLTEIQGWEVIVVVPSQGRMIEQLEKHRIPYVIVTSLGWTRSGGIKRLIGIYRAIVNAMALARLYFRFRKQSIDLVYTNTFTTPIGAVLARLLKKPHIWHIREGLTYRFDLGQSNTLKIIDRLSDLVIFNSRFIQSSFTPWLKRARLMTIYNGPLHHEKPPIMDRELPRRSALRLCIVGSIAAHKGQEDAIRGVKRLAEEGVTAHLRIVGSGIEAYLEFLQELTVSLDLTRQVEFIGFTNTPLEEFENAHIALVCSRAEPFGRTAVEAMATGCPVVSTGIDGLPEIIDDEVTGFLYPPGDVETMCRKILRLVNDPELYRHISEAGRNSVYERFTTDRYVKEISAVFNSASDGAQVD